MKTKKQKEKLNKAITILGSQSKLATSIGVTQACVSKWASREMLIPLEQAFKIQQATNGKVTINDLRPDFKGLSAA